VHRERALRQIRTGIPLILLIAGLSYWLHVKGLLIGFESIALETFAILRERQIPAEHVTIVDISDEYYAKHFTGTYPIHGKALNDVITAMAKGNPKLIAIDLDSSLWDDKDRAALPNLPPIVWARNVRLRNRTGEPGSGGYCGLPVLGNTVGIDDQYSGIAAFPADLDGVVRVSPEFLKITGLCDDPEAHPSELQSFPRAVAALYRGDSTPPVQHEDSELMLNFLGETFAFPRLEAEDVLQAADAPGSVWPTKGSMVGRIALLGGSYHAGHDFHATPRGLLTGTEIVAQAIETELMNGGIRATNEGRMVALEILLGLMLLVAGCFLSTRWALLVNLAVFALAAPIGSYIAFSTKTYWANFVPMLFGMMMHQLYHDATHK
jgi:CHASE2 domain-containing sensor protein